MNKAQSLEEDIRHGTPEHPLTAIHFTSGPGTAFPEFFYVQRHWHHSIELLKVLKGTYTAELNLENYTLKEGDICMINSGELHKIDGDQPVTSHDVVIFNPDILGFSYCDEFEESLTAPIVSHTNSLPHMIRPEMPVYPSVSALFDEITELCRKEEAGWYFGAKIQLLSMLMYLGQQDMIKPSASVQSAAEKDRIDRYKRIVYYMKQNYMRKITLEQLAEAARCNPQYLCHFFKEIAGISPVQYLIAYRIERAQDMLENTMKTVLEVSLDCGFENVSYFIRQFKRACGKTPREYRRQ